MPATDKLPRRCCELQRYEIRVQGHLDSRWATWLHGLTLTREPDGTTTLMGGLVDQAALHGLLSRIRDLGLPIISMRRLGPSSPGRDINQTSEDKEEGPA